MGRFDTDDMTFHQFYQNFWYQQVLFAFDELDPQTNPSSRDVLDCLASCLIIEKVNILLMVEVRS